jgi:hypothetical protein
LHLEAETVNIAPRDAEELLLGMTLIPNGQWRAMGGLGAALMLACLVRPARAEPGDHIRTGDAEIVPSVLIGSEYRTNVYLEEGLDGGGDSAVNPGFDILLVPRIEIGIAGADATLDLDAYYQLKKYLTPGLDNLDRYTDFGVGGTFVVLPDALLGVKIDERMSHVGAESEAVYSEHAYTEHFSNVTTGQLSVHPGGALQLDGGGTFLYDDYNVPSATNPDESFDLNERIGYGPTFNGQWKFLPKTAVVANFSYRWFDWQDNTLDAEGDEGEPTDLGAVIAIPDFTEWRAETGLRGRFTDRLVLELLLGYGQMVYDEGSVDASGDFAEGDVGADLTSFGEGFTTTVGVSYSPEETHQLSVGYKKSFEDSYFTNYLTYHLGYFRYRGVFARRWSAQTELTYRYESFVGEITRQDNVIGAKLDGAYQLSEFAALGLGVWWTERSSADGQHPEIEYDDVNVHLNATFTY